MRASGGTYLALRTGERTGCAPFKALELTPENEAFLVSLVRSMLIDEQHAFTADDTARIEMAVSGLKNIPQEQRSVSVLRELIGLAPGKRMILATGWTNGVVMGACPGSLTMIRMTSALMPT